MIRRHWAVIMSQVASYCSVSLDGAKCSGFTSARYFYFHYYSNHIRAGISISG